MGLKSDSNLERHRIVPGLDALQAELGTLLPAILLTSPGYDGTGDRAFKGEL